MLRVLSLFSVAFSASLCASGDVDALLQKAKGKTVMERTESISRGFIGLPYIDSPLGEGPGAAFDQGPLFRFDGFDCTTFVETVLALATSKKSDEFQNRLNHIRYRGKKPDYFERNHFPCVDWIPHNIQTGLLTDITRELGKPWGVVDATATVDKGSWFSQLPAGAIRIEGLSEVEREKRLQQLHGQGSKLGKQTPSLPYIPLEKIIKRNKVGETETARRKKEEDDIAAALREEATRTVQSESDDLEKKIHDKIIDQRLRYLIKDAQIDPLFFAALPDVAVVNIVRPGWKIPGTTMNVSHQGFVIRKKDDLYFRHVNRGGGKVKDVLFAHYLRLCLLLSQIKGINILALSSK